MVQPYFCIMLPPKVGWLDTKRDHISVEWLETKSDQICGLLVYYSIGSQFSGCCTSLLERNSAKLILS